MEKVKVGKKQYNLEDPDAALIETLQDLIFQLKRLELKWPR